MLDEFVYENHLGQRFYGKENGVYLNYSELRNYEWNYDIINNRISRFYRSVRNRKLPLVVVCQYEDEAIRVKNLLCELAEIDIEAGIPGKIFVGDYYTTGYITASTKSEYLINKRYCKIDFVLTSDEPAWFKDSMHVFSLHEEHNAFAGIGSDYAYDYPYDYAISTKAKRINCDSVRRNKFRIKIYGEATNPTITIADHVYTVHGMVKAGETLLIDSVNKTITLTTATGNKINWFDKRNRESYIFEPIPTGTSVVRYNGSFNFDLTVIEERSEPKWT